jgi:DNA primase
MQQLLDQAIPMVQLLWQCETEGKVFDSPERKAALDKTVREKIKLIHDPSTLKHFGQAIKEMRWKLFKPNNLRRAPAPRKGGDRQPRAKLSARHLDYIVCECSCGKTSELSAEKLEPILGEDLTAASALSLLSKLRCSECQGPPFQIFDDKKQLIFEPKITQ